MTASRVQLKQDRSTMSESHSAAMYKGVQLQPHDIQKPLGRTNTLGPQVVG